MEPRYNKGPRNFFTSRFFSIYYTIFPGRGLVPSPLRRVSKGFITRDEAVGTFYVFFPLIRLNRVAYAAFTVNAFFKEVGGGVKTEKSRVAWVTSVYSFGRIKTKAKPQGVEDKENLIVSLEHFDDIVMVDKSKNHGKFLLLLCFILFMRVTFLFSFPFDRSKL